MIEISELVSLKPYNTFQIDVTADFLIKLHNINDVKDFIKQEYLKKGRYYILGGGSNVLFPSNYKGLIVHPALQGIEKIYETNKCVLIKVSAGENWDKFVEYAVNNNWYGIENLSHIPGMVGAAPIQNIGAYGTEVKETIESVHGFMLDSGEPFELKNYECEFAYRSSIFKTRLAGKIIITHVVFRLNKQPVYNLQYKELQNKLKNYDEINLKNIRNAVIEIRKNKLPDPEIIGNAGSFFKNPTINISQALRLKSNYPNIVMYETEKDKYKLSAAWLIDQCGWKGFKNGDVGVYDKQPLVLVNYGKASGMEILDLASKIQDSVRAKFGIELEMEVNIVS